MKEKCQEKHQHPERCGVGCGSAVESSCRMTEGHGEHEHGHGHDGCGCDDCPVDFDAPEESGGWFRHWPLGIATLFTLTMVILEEALKMELSLPVRLAVYGTAYLLAATPVWREAVRRLIRWDVFNEFSLMSLASAGAFAIGDYAEGVSVMIFYCVGEIFQEAAVDRAKRSIKKLLDVRPDRVTVERQGEWKVVPAVSVKPGEVITVKPGERVALDGKLISGQAAFNTAALTGESRPDNRKSGETVLAGMVCLNTPATLRVTAAYADTMLSRMLRMIQEAAGRKSKVQLFISRFARIYTPLVVVLAALILVVPYWLVSDYVFQTWLYRALVFLVLSCPCALVISIPLGYFGGIGLASRRGILFKGANFLDMLTRVNCVVMDKTGTLTAGVFEVSRMVPAGEVTAEQLSWAAAALERYSTHPIGRTLTAAFAGVLPKATGVEELPGRGLRGRVDGVDVLVGGSKLMNEFKVAVPPEALAVPDTVVLVAFDGRFAGYITIADRVKPDAAAAVTAMRQEKLHTVLLSGDRQPLVQRLAGELGIDQAYGELLPEGKVQEVQKLRDHGKIIAFMGDGINDAPVIALSHVGVAMGGLGSDAAIEIADVVIQNDQPSKLPEAIRVARLTRNVVWQNIGLAMGVKGAVLILGAMGMATLWEAVFADVGVALLAILNAVRLQYNRKV